LLRNSGSVNGSVGGGLIFRGFEEVFEMAKKKIKARPRARSNNTRVIIGILACAALAAGVLIWANNNAAAQPSTPITAQGNVWGQANAPVTIDWYGDLQCPVCARADAELQQLAPQYIDTGKVKVVFHHFAFIGPESDAAAEAADCAGEQNQFWTYANYVYTHQAGENVGAFARDNLKKFAADLHLDTNAFNSCLDSGKYASAVRQETQQGQQLGIDSTPTFFINGQRYVGLLPTDQLAQVIDSYLH
jgi:protein-disulfide isomerase